MVDFRAQISEAVMYFDGAAHKLHTTYAVAGNDFMLKTLAAGVASFLVDSHMRR